MKTTSSKLKKRMEFALFQSSLRDRLEEVAKNSSNNNNKEPAAAPDLTGLVTWDRLEDALRGIRESLAKSSTDAAAALASARDQRPPVQVVERTSQTVSDRSRTRLIFIVSFSSRPNRESVPVVENTQSTCVVII